MFALSTCGIQTYAQNIVLTSTSVTYPHERGQWTTEQCAAWQAEYGPIRGINCPYPACNAVSQEEAIAVCARLGYNSIRWWPSSGSVDDYIHSVEQWAAWADKYGMTVSPVFSFVYGFYGEKGDESSLKGMETWVRKITKHFRGDKRIILWDIWNEPNMNDSKTEGMMAWISEMVKWMQQEGCTQPISSSIVWDTGVGTNKATATGLRLLRENTEKLMDVHNYHDYSCQDGFNQETETMYTRLKRLGDRPLVCTECMTRVNGSTYARTLVDFAKYNINFYTWGLSACDPNWEVKWSRSTFYNWDPMFHNALYADYEPYNESEPQWVKNFDFQGNFNGVETGAEYTEVWSPRRAWRWMQHEESKGIMCNGIDEAETAISAHRDDRLYNTLSIRVGYSTWASGNSAFKTKFNTLLDDAEKADMTVIPVLLSSKDMNASVSNLADYVYNFINAYYKDRRIQAWCIYEQTEDGTPDNALKDKLATILRKARYAVQNQPFFMAPKASQTMPDSTSTDVVNWMWKLGDAVGISSSTTPGNLLTLLMQQYHKPIFQLGNTELTKEMADNHVNWMTEASFKKDEVESYKSSPVIENNENKSGRWPAWKAYRWMNRPAIRGIACSNMSTALKTLNSLRGSHTPYNSLSVMLDLRTYTARQSTFYAEMDSLLKMAEEMDMTVLPQLLSDNYINMASSRLTAYVSDVLSHYATNPHIIAWDLYNNVCSASGSTKIKELVDALFEAGRSIGACQPLYMTPCVSTNTFSADFDAIKNLEHGVYAGWSKLSYGKGDIKLCYKIWCLSDVICYASSQRSNYLGWLNAQANKFGRPIFCATWKPAAGESANNTLDIFSDMHVSWYVNGTLEDDAVESFKYRPVSTAH